jgi:hypothetical protein
VKYVRDTTRRFLLRPHYDPAELDEWAERLIVEFMDEKCGGFTIPIPTDVLTKLIERDAADLDSSIDLQTEGSSDLGVTDFFPGEKPRVCIDASLWKHQWLETRLRATLAHEYGHVTIHAPLHDREQARNVNPPPKKKDWMEWQAWYFAGALLMPVSSVARFAEDFRRKWPQAIPPLRDGYAQEIHAKAQKDFFVSSEVAGRRLYDLKVTLKNQSYRV